MFEFGKDLFNRVEIRAVGRKKEEPRTCLLDGGSDSIAFVAAKIVHDDNVTGPETWNEDLLDIEQKTFAIDWPIEDTRSGNPVAAKGGKESQGFPMAMGDVGHQSAALQAPSANGGHIGLGPCFINEHQARGVNPALVFAPPKPSSGDIRPLLFGCVNGFF